MWAVITIMVLLILIPVGLAITGIAVLTYELIDDIRCGERSKIIPLIILYALIFIAIRAITFLIFAV